MNGNSAGAAGSDPGLPLWKEGETPLATIRTAIALYDGVTAPLKSMHKAMNIVLNSFEAMQRASGNSVDTSAIREAREELARAGAAFDSIEENIRNAGNQQDRFNRRIRDGTTAADGLWSKLKGIAATVGGLAAVKKILGVSDQLTSTNARLNNAMINFDDGGSLTDLEKKVMASAQRSRTSYMDAASSIAKLGLNARDAFGSMDEVIAFQELINKQFIIGGASVQEQQAAMIQLTQAMASGVLRGEELNSVFEQAPGIIQSIADYLDVSIGEIRAMAAEGQLTADVVKNAMFAAADDIETKFSNMPKTWGQIWIGMKNKALSIFNPILNKVNQVANSEKFTQVTNGVTKTVTIQPAPTPATKPTATVEPPKRETSQAPKQSTYTVKSGDCLWNIAKKYLGDGSRYNEIYNLNKDKIKNPNLIYAGQVLTLPS